MKALFAVLPLAIVMSAGPQIVTAVFLATSREPRRNSLAFLTSVAVATTIGVTVFFFLGSGLSEDRSNDSGKNWLDWVIIGLLVLLGIPPLLWLGHRISRSRPLPHRTTVFGSMVREFVVCINELVVPGATRASDAARSTSPWST